MCIYRYKYRYRLACKISDMPQNKQKLKESSFKLEKHIYIHTCVCIYSSTDRQESNQMKIV